MREIRRRCGGGGGGEDGGGGWVGGVGVGRVREWGGGGGERGDGANKQTIVWELIAEVSELTHNQLEWLFHHLLFFPFFSSSSKHMYQHVFSFLLLFFCYCK